MANEMTVPDLVIDTHTFGHEHRYVIHGALLAQVDDVHAAGVYMWDEAEYERAAEVLSLLNGSPVGDVPMTLSGSAAARAISQSLLVPLYDLDHPDLAPEEWDEAERVLALLAEEFGR